MANLFNILDIAVDPEPTQNIAPVLLVLLFLVVIVVGVLIGVLIIVKSKKAQTNNDNTIPKATPQFASKPKEIPIKNTSIIEDPATVRMAIEESKADLNDENDENNTTIDEKTKSENNTVHIDDNKIDDDII